MDRPRFDLADIVRRHRDALERSQSLSSGQARALSAIALCRTAALGGHVNICAGCGLREDPSYNSCRNRHCPKCQALAQEAWIARRSEAILPIPHYHAVFTLPEDLRPLARSRPREVFAQMFRCAAAALMELARTRLRVTLGLTLVLHTWTRDLRFHPHLHVLVTAGGLDCAAAGFRHLPARFLLPVRPLAILFKGKVMAGLRGLQGKGGLGLTPGAFGSLMAALARQSWRVYLKQAFHSAQGVLAYLGRYTHRVGIANSRLLEVSDDRVTFRTRGVETRTLPPVIFLQRFIQHVLPERFKKIRHAGLYAAPRALAEARARLGQGAPARSKPLQATWEEALLAHTQRDVLQCPGCGQRLFRSLIPAQGRFHSPLRAPGRSPP